MSSVKFLPAIISVCFLTVSCASMASSDDDFMLAQEAFNRANELNTQRETSCEAIDDTTIRFTGRTDRALSICLLENSEATKLVVSSNGGPVRHAIPAAELIAKRSMAVEVIGLCASSCGNYLLPAAETVSVKPYSAILLHGAPPSDPEKIRASVIEGLKNSGLEAQANSDEFLDEQVEKMLKTRQQHDKFQIEEDVGKEWYDLSFYYQQLQQDGQTKGPLIVSKEFFIQCLNTTTELVEFWEPATADEDTKFRSLFKRPILIAGTDIPGPLSCR